MTYDIDEVINAGDPGHVQWGVDVATAVNDLDDRAAVVEAAGVVGAPAGKDVQFIPNVGGTFTTTMWRASVGTYGLREAYTACLPILIPQTITIDLISFNIVTAAAAGQVADLNLVTLNATEDGYDVVTSLATSIPLDAIAVKSSAVSLTLTPGVHGFQLRQPGTSYDATLRISAGTLIGPWVNSPAHLTVGVPIGAGPNVIAVPHLKLRRSA